MRLSIIAIISLFAAAAFAEDTKPPVIQDVKASVNRGNVTVEARITDETGVLSAIVHHRGKGGKVEDAQMVKNDYDDVFKATFPGGGDTEYWIESSDLLGNGPSMYGSASKPFAAGGKPAKGGTAVAKNEPPPAEEKKQPPPPQQEVKREPPPERKHREPPPPKEEPPPQKQEETKAEEPPPERKVAKVAAPPVIEHHAPRSQPPEGREFTVRVKIHSESPVAVAILQSQQQGASGFVNTPLAHTEGDGYEAKIAGDQAKGTVSYFIAAKNQAGQMARKGDSEDNKTPYMIIFKPSGAAVAASTAPSSAGGPFGFTHNAPFRVLPGKPIVIRAQVVPTPDDGQMPDRVAVLFRGNDGQDQIVDMDPDQNGGWGGFKAELPAQDEGAVFYQVVACDAGATKCAVDTGSKRKWHGAAVAAQPGGAQPLPFDAVSQKAPPSLPE
jgi:hypothetical protein